MSIKDLIRTTYVGSLRGRRNGLSEFGRILKKFSTTTLFLIRSLELEAFYRNHPEGRSKQRSKISDVDDWVYDVGANDGEDTGYYLMKGYRVVAIEANPHLAEKLNSKFSEDVVGGKLIIVNAAVIDDDRPSIEFFIHRNNDKISCLIPPSGQEAEFDKVTVPACRLSSLIRAHGNPHYVKIDIEGYDQKALAELFALGIHPQFISAESHTIEVLCHLVAAGYSRFKIVEGKYVHFDYFVDMELNSEAYPSGYRFPEGKCCGPFGDDIPGPWVAADDVFRHLALHGLGWKDIHAAL